MSISPQLPSGAIVLHPGQGRRYALGRYANLTVR
jgi:hypothetical protein